jgi:hypothetical protein
MIVKLFTPAFLAAAAAAVISAPAAGASSADCDDTGPASVCSRGGHTSIFAEPRQSGGGQNLFMAPGGAFGSVSTPPLMAID